MKKLIKEKIIVLLLLFVGCTDPIYFMGNQTPPNLVGFLGIRWTTPYGLVKNEFPKRTGAKPLQQLNKYNTSVYTDFKFWDWPVKICQFSFDEKGLRAIELVFNTNNQNYEKEFNDFKVRLNKIYGDSNNINIWFDGRLELKLMPNYNIVIKAYRERGYPYTREN